jgi:hypothetical protein
MTPKIRGIIHQKQELVVDRKEYKGRNFSVKGASLYGGDSCTGSGWLSLSQPPWLLELGTVVGTGLGVRGGYLNASISRPSEA